MTASKTTNSGSIWSRYHLSTLAGMAFCATIDHTNSNIVYIGGSTGLFKTTNGGTSWFNSTNGITDTLFDIAIDITNTNILYAATPDGIFKTTNAGANWTNTGCTGARAVLIDPDDNDRIFAGTSTGVYQSTVGGGSWSAMNAGLNGSHVTSLGINTGTYLFAGTEDAAMFRWSLQVGTAEQHDREASSLLLSCMPNPAYGRTSIFYTLPGQSHVHISIYDVQGRLVRTLVDQVQVAGEYMKQWDCTDKDNQSVAAGIYLYRMTTDIEERIQKLVVLK